MLEKLQNGEDIGPPLHYVRNIRYTPKPLTDIESESIDQSLMDQFEKLNNEVEEICDPKNWGPPKIQNSLGLFNYVNRGLALAEGNPVLEAQMLRSMFGLICENLDDKTSRRVAQAIWDR
jgi:hypothetical protein